MAQNVVGSLVVSLKAQTAEFAKGLKGAVSESTAAAGRIESALAGIGRGFKTALGTLGVALGAREMVSRLRSLLSEGAEISKQADKLNLTAEAYQRIAKAADEGGVSVQIVGEAVQRMSARIGANAMPWEKLGLTADAARGKSQLDTFRMIGQAIQNIEDPMQRAAAATAAFSESGAKLDAVFRLLDANKDWQIISDEQISRLREADEYLNRIGQNIKVGAAGVLMDLQEYGLAMKDLVTGGVEGMNEGFIRRGWEAREERLKRLARAQAVAMAQEAANVKPPAPVVEDWMDRTAMETLFRRGDEARRREREQMMARFDPLAAYQQSVAQIGYDLPAHVRSAALADARKTAIAAMMQTSPEMSGLPAGAERYSMEASRAIAEFNAGAETQKRQEELLREAVEKLDSIDRKTNAVGVAPFP